LIDFAAATAPSYALWLPVPAPPRSSNAQTSTVFDGVLGVDAVVDDDAVVDADPAAVVDDESLDPQAVRPNAAVAISPARTTPRLRSAM